MEGNEIKVAERRLVAKKWHKVRWTVPMRNVKVLVTDRTKNVMLLPSSYVRTYRRSLSELGAMWSYACVSEEAGTNG